MAKFVEVEIIMPENLEVTLNYGKILRKAQAPLLKATKSRIRKGVDVDGNKLPRPNYPDADKPMRHTGEMLAKGLAVSKPKRKRPKKVTITGAEGYRADGRAHKQVLFALNAGKAGKKKIEPRKIIGATKANEAEVNAAAQAEVDRQVKAGEAKLAAKRQKKIKK